MRPLAMDGAKATCMNCGTPLYALGGRWLHEEKTGCHTILPFHKDRLKGEHSEVCK